jgi:hypothetical protein
MKQEERIEELRQQLPDWIKAAPRTLPNRKFVSSDAFGRFRFTGAMDLGR